MMYRVTDYSLYKERDGQGEWDSGILKASLSSWDEFHKLTGLLLDLGDFVWRGQTQDWPLISKFDRLVTSNRTAKLEAHMNAFVRAIKGRRGNNPPELNNEEEIWSLGQHYGLATPLLDWTESPFVAAYFAFRQKPLHVIMNTLIAVRMKDAKDKSEEGVAIKDAPSRFIYGLSKDIGRWGPATSNGGEPYAHFIRFVEPLSDENPRLLNQKGLYTMPMSPEIEIEKTVEQCYAKDKEKGRNRIVFIKIQIPELERKTCLRNLNRMNINHATLFPDLTGAAEYCNLNLEIENYS